MPKKKPKKTSFLGRQKKFSDRQLIKAAIILLAAIMLISVASYVVSVNVKLLFDTETHITLSPSITSITIPDKTAPTVPFSTTTEKLSVCDITCTHELVDVTNGKTLNKTVIEAKETTTIDYDLPIRGFGEGQSAYTYTVTCTTTNKTLCPSKGKQYQQTAFVTVNYGLSEEETRRKARLERTLPTQTAVLANAHTTLDGTIALIDALNEYTDLREVVFGAAVLQKDLGIADDQEAVLLEAWREERYEEAQALMEEHASHIDNIMNQVNNVSKRTRALHATYEKAANITRTIHEQRDMISGWTGFLSRTNKTGYEALTNASTTYAYITNTFLEPAALLQQAETINNTVERSKTTYVIGKAAQQAAKNILRATYEPLLQALNETWQGEDCDDYEEMILVFNTTNTSTAIITEYVDVYCQDAPTTQLFTETPLPSIRSNESIAITPTIIPEPTPTCCYRDACKPCDAAPPTPIILVHGHSFSKSSSPELAFTRLRYLQTRLARDGHLHASTINAEADIDKVPRGDWGKQPVPVVVSVTYYYLNYHDLGQLSFTTRKGDSIENYAIRLKEAVDTVKEKTGSEDVILIAHSMGGLVAREYLYLFGDEDVKTLIMVGTPNHGIQGDIKKYCTLTGARQECEEMAAESPFLKILNDPEKNPKRTAVYTIRATGCPTRTDTGATAPGDGVVLAESVILDFAQENYEVKGTCEDVFQTSLHMDFINPLLYPETYTYIKRILAQS